MIRFIAGSVLHQNAIGGIALATLIVGHKRDDAKTWGTWFSGDASKPVLGPLCGSCLSCTRGKCYFAYRKYPECLLEKGK